METENTGNESTEQTETISLENLQNEMAQMRALMAQGFQANSPKPEKKPDDAFTRERFAELFKSKPDEAIELALEAKVKEKTQAIERQLTQKQEKVFFDKKAADDFPLLTSDKKFQDTVRNYVQELVQEGEYTQNSPRLVYRAAQLAALAYKAEGKTPSKTQSVPTGEAPRHVNRREQRSAAPDNFEQLSSIFKLSKESKERLQKKFK